MSAALALGPGREFDLLRAIFRRIGTAAAADGLGDDCAVVPLGDTNLVASIDMSVEGVHFRTAWLTFEEIGWRAAAAALSDLAAEGAEPVGVLVALGLPGATGKREALKDSLTVAGNVEPGVEIMAGVGACVASVGAKVLGGDLVRSDKYLIDVAAIGTAARPVRRAGARAGDGVWVTGALGGPALALRAWEAGGRPAPALARRFARPEPRIGAGRWLAARGATAMIDVSDGLAADAGHLAAASALALEIELERVPRWDGVEPLAAVASGEEYELLVTLPDRFGPEEARQFHVEHVLSLTRIGRCAAGAGLRLTQAGQPVTPPAGYDHFAAP